MSVDSVPDTDGPRITAMLPAQPAYARAIGLWLLACAALVFVMVVIGGVTRLTRSGLSIVEWAPIAGILPPLNEAQWLEVFAKYQQTPEYKQVNFGMSLDAFKGIFWWEYIHRLLGRVIGLAFLLPYLWFLAKRAFDRLLAWKLLGLFALGALQGGLGWFMVQSGLVDDPRVSHIRLTAHLALAFLIFAAMLWISLDLLRPPRRSERSHAPPAWVGSLGIVVCALVFVMVVSGGFVAGIRAGYAYNTFPLMNGHVLPPEILIMDPWYLNFTNNMATVQFNHRVLALVLAVAGVMLWWGCRRSGVPTDARQAANVLLVVLLLQIALGISTLLLRVPIVLGAAHQGGAVVVFAVALWTTHCLLRVRGES